MNYGAGCYEKGSGYLDDYGINPTDYGLAIPIIAGIIGAASTVVGTTGGLVKAGMSKKMQREALAAQEELIKAQRIAHEESLRLERAKIAQRQQLVWIGVPLLLIGFIAVVRIRGKQ